MDKSYRGETRDTKKLKGFSECGGCWMTQDGSPAHQHLGFPLPAADPSPGQKSWPTTPHTPDHTLRTSLEVNKAENDGDYGYEAGRAG